MTTALTSAQTRFLRGQAHDLKAMLQVGGKGISEALVAEVDLALEHEDRDLVGEPQGLGLEAVELAAEAALQGHELAGEVVRLDVARDVAGVGRRAAG